MPLIYKIDVLVALREKGYNTNYIRKHKLISEGSMQNMREQKPISWTTLETLCKYLELQSGDILEYIPEDEGILSSIKLSRSQKAGTTP